MVGVEQVGEEPKLRWLRRASAGIMASTSPGGRPELSAPRLGVLGGTFNPPTRAHLALADHASRELRLDEILFVLPETPPHKKQLEASLEDRAEMVLRAIAGSEKFSAAIATHGLFLDIHRALAPHYPPLTRVFFLVGEDAAERILLDWLYEDPAQALEEMFRRFEFAVAQRGKPFAVPADSLTARYATKIHSVHIPAEWETLSATRARERVARGEPIEDIVPSQVASYIANRGLYRGAGS